MEVRTFWILRILLWAGAGVFTMLATYGAVRLAEDPNAGYWHGRDSCLETCGRRIASEIDHCSDWQDWCTEAVQTQDAFAWADEVLDGLELSRLEQCEQEIETCEGAFSGAVECCTELTQCQAAR